MASPATIDTASGRNTGRVIVNAARAAKTPLWVTWLRKVGPSFRSGPPPTFRATTMATGMSKSTVSRAWTRGAAQLGQGPLGEETTEAHDCDMRARLFDLGEEVAGHEHGGPVGVQLTDEVANLTGSLWVHAVGGLVEDEQLAAVQERSR